MTALVLQDDEPVWIQRGDNQIHICAEHLNLTLPAGTAVDLAVRILAATNTHPGPDVDTGNLAAAQTNLHAALWTRRGRGQL